MTPPADSVADFLTEVEAELQLRGVSYSRGELAAWIGAVWPLVEDNPHVGRWARQFIDAAAAAWLSANAKECQATNYAVASSNELIRTGKEAAQEYRQMATQTKELAELTQRLMAQSQGLAKPIMGIGSPV
jgi:hypothetical protein